MITNLSEFRIHLIVEAAKSFTDLKDCILLKLQSKNAIKLTLYNYKDASIIGYVKCVKPGTQSFWEVERINADKGFGPLLYDILMMLVYPLGIKPGSLIKPAALSIYQYYVTKRTDVEKQQIKDNNPVYVDSYRNDVEGEELKDQNNLRLINTVYYLKPTDNFNKFITESNQLIESYNLDVKSIIKNAENNFLELYYGAII